MISLGTNITTVGDQLQKYPLKTICDAIRSPRPELQTMIRQLRILRDIDSKQYAAAKRQLPYIVCGIFSSAVRRSDDFAYTEYFIIDIDHLSDKGLDIASTKTSIVADSRVVACFISPGGDGLKVVFKLSEKCYDKGIYSRFYKIFANDFAVRNDFAQVVDTRTCDVARACFVSHDPEIYYNPEAEAVVLSDFLNLIDVDAQETALHEIEKNELSIKEKPEKVDPDDSAIEKIKATLNPKLAYRQQNKTPAYVPQVLNDIIEDLRKHIEGKGIVIKEIRDIQYGKKISVCLGLKEAEVNLFYGKRGFSIVQTSRTGTDAELNQVVTDVISEFIYSY